MVNVNNMDIEQLVKFINIELSKNKNLSVNKFCELNDIKKSTLKSRMSRADYSYNIDLRKYVKNNTTSNTTEVLQEVSAPKEDTQNKVILLNDIETGKLNLLLNNIDSILELVEKKNNTSSITINSDKTKVTSLRINEELYDMIKDKSAKSNISISDIVNRALMDYLNNYI
ncbi:hypothetical protein GKZ28_26095 [Clostridium chromiireducens]|uniref:Uncharacterized protein n=1 Tax=Clostridium chromiireducens TaxID=225345 RepID=A0A964RST1_9CLOT|nr:hypothetical protein [Clostridium chromiireducens]MVX67125.1 hypothetical protein [Clostridium chromiireducens]